MTHRIIRQLQFGLAIQFLTIIIGTAGYMVIEKRHVLEVFYMTVITITTTGFEEVRQLSQEGRLFTIKVI